MKWLKVRGNNLHNTVRNQDKIETRYQNTVEVTQKKKKKKENGSGL